MEIRKFLFSIIGNLRLGGSRCIIHNTSDVLHDNEEEEHGKSYHSEKLAIAIALFNLENRTVRFMTVIVS